MQGVQWSGRESATRFRRPMPATPIDRFAIGHPELPRALEGLRVLHVSDPHVRRSERISPWWGRVLSAVERTPADLMVLTGDYMNHAGDEHAALWMLARLVRAARCRLGVFGVMGNHDTPTFAELAKRVRGVRWLWDEQVDVPGLPLRLIGTGWPEDVLSASLSDGALAGAGEERGGRFRMVLAHRPTALVPSAALGHHLVLAGHTHGGQVRLHAGMAPHTSSDLPPDLASGVLRLGSTLCCVSRGLGEAVVPGLRVNCPAHLPLYTLQRRALAGGGDSGEAVRQVVAW